MCVEWVLHTTHGVYGFPTNGHTWGITQLDIVLKIYSHLHTLNLNIIELLALQGEMIRCVTVCVCMYVCRLGACYNSLGLQIESYELLHQVRFQVLLASDFVYHRLSLHSFVKALLN